MAPCRARCPVHIDVPSYLSAVAEGRFSDALATVLERNPLPAVCGRVCLRPCEEGCRRCLLDEPVAIAHIKRAAADHGLYPVHVPVRRRPESIAVIGGGPTGLTAAFDLAKLGFAVTIYESQEKLGGMLRYGIPAYRLPDYALDRDIAHILDLGIEVETGVAAGKDVTLEELSEKHDAVLVATGLAISRSLPIGGADLPRVLTALPFLEAAAKGEPMAVGPRVLVVGGGNVAMDVARTALRSGAEAVDVVCLESRDEMPASEHELEEAEQEGVRIHCSWGPSEIVSEDGRVTGLSAKACTAVFDAEGRFAPTFDEEAIERFHADDVILAIGQGADAECFDVPLTRGLIEVDPATLRTTNPDVWAAGDVVSGPTKVIDAIAAGHQAAASIVAELTGDATMLLELQAENEALGDVPEHVADKIETRRRVQMEKLEIYEAMDNFDEIELGYTEYEAAREAQRCLSCTTGARLAREKCAACLTCARVCPHGAPVIQLGGYPYFSADACHACGACAAECPAHAIKLEGCSGREMSLRVQRELARPKVGQVLAFVCGCTADTVGEIGKDARIIVVPCLLRASERAVMEALELGAHRVVFSGCVEDMCRFPNAIKHVAKRVARIRSMARELGMPESFEVTEGDGSLGVALSKAKEAAK